MVELGRLHVIEGKVQYAYYVYRFEFIVPYFSLDGLLPDGVSGVIDASVLEELLFPFLHLNQDFLSFLVLAIDIEDGTAFGFPAAQMFGVQVGDIFYDLFTVEQGIEKSDKNFLVQVGSEQQLECKIGIGVHIPLA